MGVLRIAGSSKASLTLLGLLLARVFPGWTQGSEWDPKGSDRDQGPQERYTGERWKFAKDREGVGPRWPW